MQSNRSKDLLRLCIVVLFVAITIFSGLSCSRGGTLTVPGTGACEGIVTELANAFCAANTGYQVLVPPSVGSGGGIKRAGTGESVMSRIARPIKESEAHYGLSYMEFAKDRVVFVVSSGVGISSLTAAQLADIFSGKIRNWSQVGGSEAAIRVFSRESGDCSLQIIQEQLSPFKDLNFAGEVMYHDYEMLAALENNRNSIGFLTSSSLIGKKPKAIMLDGVEPSVSNVTAGRYTLALNYAFVYKEDLLDKTARKFIDYIHSSAGRKILEDHGMIPVSP